MSDNQAPTNLVKPSDAKSWSLCARRVWFDNQPSEGPEIDIGEFDQLVIDLGLTHEKTILERLSQEERKIAELVKLRFYTGLTLEQASKILNVSRRTADRYWLYAKAWLYKEIAND